MHAEQAIRECLLAAVLPGLSSPLAELADVGPVEQGACEVVLGFPARRQQQQYQDFLQSRLAEQGLECAVSVGWRVASHQGSESAPAMANVRNIIAVASGKGGVGKSTTSVNLALALAAEGARVGLLDADIYGPSVQMMLGVASGTRPKQYGSQHLLPVEAHGLQSMSMAYLVTEKTPMVWRGPMASGALQQLLNQTYWQDLDYLIIDMPPGTGDIQLTLSQKVPLAGAVIVTTPQDIALLDAKKGIEMFSKVSVPVLGVVENMAVHICSQCGHAEHIFGEGGGHAIAAEYGVPMLGALPLSLQIREQADSGQPVMVADPDGEAAGLYRDVALNMAAALAKRSRHSDAAPSISISDD
ncbi:MULTISPECIES: iron-sulfur cluster carrier protein ApbC [Spongiibacter]|uniref:iron-sulfur cluster carrier protein ApbC n=2 Tax=Spongiibacteraceae TaxID=1706375 RepID=UPI000C57730C|nr:MULTISPECIES: iron-sulfur cluster carrier protein ApbC [Spongiibacter]MAY40600.1 iron-sulfur cluster carrier protein ApbC [Spongiibacter sp.]MBI59545.1 iron-sulfur cluster carrier protein ApbC [Spongiibacter sp.]MBO6754645.1 iron-sulfur cluster carrier protein ApbC [Spongiibacter sp.]MBU72764.1 iron-sulfur cluster carrier protein ApbC [Spongiibacter sp.]